MIIVDLTKITKQFCEIRFGVVFKWEPEGSKPSYYIKVPEIFDQHSQEKYNAVNLEDGEWDYLAEYEEIVPYDATLQLEY